MNNADATPPAPPVQNNERLGRRVTDPIGKERRLKRLLKQLETTGGGVPFQEFLSPLKQPDKISVDRLDLMSSPQEIGNIALRDAKTEGRVFHGWVVVIAGHVFWLGFAVEPSPIYPPLPPNPCHADIVFLGSAEEINFARKMHAENLAENAKWLPCRELRTGR